MVQVGVCSVSFSISDLLDQRVECSCDAVHSSQAQSHASTPVGTRSKYVTIALYSAVFT